MKKRAIERAIGDGQRSGAASESGGPAADDMSPAAQSYRRWLALGKPRGGIEAPGQRAKAKRPRYDALKAKLDKITVDDAESELKRKREALKKYPKKRNNGAKR